MGHYRVKLYLAHQYAKFLMLGGGWVEETWRGRVPSTLIHAQRGAQEMKIIHLWLNIAISYILLPRAISNSQPPTPLIIKTAPTSPLSFQTRGLRRVLFRSLVVCLLTFPRGLKYLYPSMESMHMTSFLLVFSRRTEQWSANWNRTKSCLIFWITLSLI